MKFVIENAGQEDIEKLFSHLFKRQFGLLVGENNLSRVYIEPDNITDLLFIANILKCNVLIKPNSFQHGDRRYSVLEIVR